VIITQRYLKEKERNLARKYRQTQITPVETNADKQSQFVAGIDAMPSNASKPVFLNFDKDIQKIKHWSSYCFICSKYRQPNFPIKMNIK
jgi:hypothetical protein